MTLQYLGAEVLLSGPQSVLSVGLQPSGLPSTTQQKQLLQPCSTSSGALYFADVTLFLDSL